MDYLTKKELIEMCKELKIKGYSSKNKKEIIDLLKTHKKEQNYSRSKKESLLKDPTNTDLKKIMVKMRLKI